jgi:hypothetical protein
MFGSGGGSGGRGRGAATVAGLAHVADLGCVLQGSFLPFDVSVCLVQLGPPRVADSLGKLSEEVGNFTINNRRRCPHLANSGLS